MVTKKELFTMNLAETWFDETEYTNKRGERKMNIVKKVFNEIKLSILGKNFKEYLDTMMAVNSVSDDCRIMYIESSSDRNIIRVTKHGMFVINLAMVEELAQRDETKYEDFALDIIDFIKY